MQWRDIAIAVIFWAGVIAYRAIRRSKYPHRIQGLLDALQVHADLRKHQGRASDAAHMQRIRDGLDHARQLVNSSPAEVARDWRMVQDALRQSIDPDVLDAVGLAYSDLRGDTVAAVAALETRLRKLLARSAIAGG